MGYISQQKEYNDDTNDTNDTKLLLLYRTVICCTLPLHDINFDDMLSSNHLNEPIVSSWIETGTIQ